MVALKRIMAVVAVVAAVGLPAIPAAAGELTDLESIQTYLSSIGVDPSDAIVQDGGLNYAGPSCPGGAWSCVTVTGPVVQMNSGGINIFESTASDDPNTCTVVQTNTTGTNDATCTLSTATNGTTQRIRITQSNGSGANNATATTAATLNDEVAVGLTAAFDQKINQHVQISQTSTTGASTADIVEDADLTAAARAVSNASSKQDTFAIAILEQASTTGNLTAAVKQDHSLESRFLDITGNTTQEQQTRATGLNIVTEVFQDSDAGLVNLDFDQNHAMNMVADNVLGTITETQGNGGGGMIGDIDQTSDTNIARYDADVVKTLTMDNEADTAVQYDDPICCDFGNLSPHTPDDCTVDITVTASGPANVLTDAFLQGRTFAETTCAVNLTLSLQKGEAAPQVYTESRNAAFVDVFISAEDGVVTSGDSPQEATSTKGNLHYAIRNVSDGESFDSTDAGRPDFSDGDVGEIFELKIAFHNHTKKPIPDLVMSAPVPTGTTFLSCDACFGGVPDPVTGRVVFNRGIGEAGGTRLGVFRVQVTGPEGLYTTQASATSDKGTIVSNVIRYWIS